VRKINREGARIAREAAQGRGLVAGAIGPIGKPLAPIGNVRPEDAQEAYREQAEGLLDGGVDLFLLETMPSLDQAKAALAGVRSVHGRRARGGEPDLQRGRQHDLRRRPGGGGPRARSPRGHDDRRELQPGAAGDAGDAAANGRRRPRREALRHAQRGLGRPRRGALRVPLHPGVHGHLGPPLPGGRGHGGGRLLRHDPRPHKGPRPLRPHVPAGARRGEDPPALAPPRGAGPRAAGGEVAPRSAPPAGSSWSRSRSTRPGARDPGALLERAQLCRESEIDAINVADGPRASARIERAGALRPPAGKGGDRHHPALHLSRPEPPRDPVGPPGRPRAGTAEHPRDHGRPPQARRLPGRGPQSTTSTRSGSSGSWTTSTTGATSPGT